jgi:hypothetical protein
MAPRITGSADRKKRQNSSSNRPVTQGQNPQRSNRQGVSKATVSNGGTRGNTPANVTVGRGGRSPSGTARVTGAPAPKALPPGNKGGALAKVTKALPAGKVPNALPAGKVGGALAKTGAKSLLAKAAVPVDIALTANSIFNPNSEGSQQLGKALNAVNQRYAGKSGPRFKNPNTGSVASKGAKPTATMPKGSGDALREKSYAALQKFDVPKPKAKPASLKAAASAPSRSTAGQRSTGSSMSRSTPKPPAKAQPGQSKDMNENYQMWAKANPALAAKVKSNQSGYNAFAKDAVAGVGPVKDGASYKPQPEKTSEMNASAVRRAALTASAGSATDSGSSDTPKEKPKGTGSNFRTDIALLDKKKKR